MLVLHTVGCPAASTEVCLHTKMLRLFDISVALADIIPGLVAHDLSLWEAEAGRLLQVLRPTWAT